LCLLKIIFPLLDDEPLKVKGLSGRP
jgi:hypothetical protein